MNKDTTSSFMCPVRRKVLSKRLIPIVLIEVGSIDILLLKPLKTLRMMETKLRLSGQTYEQETSI